MNQLEQDNALFDLIAVRGTLATIFDGLFPSNNARGVQPQVLLDMLLLELDRGIDLLALGAGTTEEGPTERRAIALWSIVAVILKLLTPDGYPAALGNGPLPAFRVKNPVFNSDITQIQTDYAAATRDIPGFRRALLRYHDIELTQVVLPLTDKQEKGVAEELRVQVTLEDRWENLVRTVAPEAGDQQSVFMLLQKIVEQAAFEVLGGLKLPRLVPPLPPQFEQSLATLFRRP
jgi:hypothetical protein